MVRHGVRLGIAASAAVVSVAALGGAAFTFLGRGRIADAVTTLGIDPLGGSALAFAQALYAPNISVWMVGWMSGQGFVVGEGSLYAPATVTADALPAFPIFGALPHTEGGMLVWAPLLIVVLAAVSRLALARRMGSSLKELDTAGFAVLVVVAVIALLGTAATGAIGPGRLAQAGVEVLPVTATVGALAGVGFAVGHGLAWLLEWLRRRRQPILSVVRPETTTSGTARLDTAREGAAPDGAVPLVDVPPVTVPPAWAPLRRD
jgi:hypothetical protein